MCTYQWVRSEPVCQHHPFPVGVKLVVVLAEPVRPLQPHAPPVHRHVTPGGTQQHVTEFHISSIAIGYIGI